MNRHWLRAAFLVAAAGGCSSGGGSTTPGVPEVSSVVRTTTISSPTGGKTAISSSEDKDVSLTKISAPLDSVWHALPGVFLELGIEPGTVDQDQHYIANTSFIVRRTLGGVQLARYLDCGSTVTGKTANQSQVNMSVDVQAVAGSDSTSVLRSQVRGSAVMEGVVGNVINCSTTGGLEDRIARMVNDDLAHRTKHSP